MNNPVTAFVIAVPIFLAFRRRMQIEEQALLDALGERYRSYTQKTMLDPLRLSCCPRYSQKKRCIIWGSSRMSFFIARPSPSRRI